MNKEGRSTKLAVDLRHRGDKDSLPTFPAPDGVGQIPSYLTWDDSEETDDRLRFLGEKYSPDRYRSHDEVVDALSEVVGDQTEYLVFFSLPRSSSTAILASAAGHPDVDLAVFQPFKWLLRNNDAVGQSCNPPVVLDMRRRGGTVFIKDNVGPFVQAEIYDPVDLLVRAGVPPANIRIVCYLRNPLDTIASHVSRLGGIDLAHYHAMQQAVIGLIDRHPESREQILPFVDSLFGENGERLFPSLQKLFGHLGLSFQEGNMNFPEEDKIPPQKTQLLEADESFDPSYHEGIWSGTLNSGRFMHIPRNFDRVRSIEKRLTDPYQMELIVEIMKAFSKFERMARKSNNIL